MADLQWWAYLAIGVIFVWGGFVRSALGFGGAALTLPLLLLVVDSPVAVLPIIAIHLIVFGSIAVGRRLGVVDWRYLLQSMKVLMPFKIAGVFGLLSLPGEVLTAIVYAITAVYAVTYIIDLPVRSGGGWTDQLLLALGGYISGTSLTGAPLIIAVYARHVAQSQLRETLFALWIILVVIKLAAFYATGTDLQLVHQLWLLPAAALGHWLGLGAHRSLQRADPKRFMRVIGIALLLVTAVGTWMNFIRTD